MQYDYLIIGQGATAASVAAYCERSGQSYRVAAQVEALGGDEHRQVGEVVLSPGIARGHPAVAKIIADGWSVVGDIELFARAFRGRVLGITGSNGKSTAVTMLHRMCVEAGLSVALGGNIGVPALDLLREPHDIAVLELSSFQLESCPSLRCDAAAVLNVSEDHLDRYEGLDDYAATKRAIYRDCPHCVANADDTRTHTDGAARLPVGEVVERGQLWVDGSRLTEPDLTEPGLELGGVNLVNASFAATLASAVGVDHKAIVAALRQFEPLAHRMQAVATLAGICFVNDSKGTNPGATVAAINGASGPVIAILGGQTKGADLAPIKAALDAKGKAFITVGQDAALFEAVLSEAVLNECVFLGRVNNLDEAVSLALQHGDPGDVCLLSPAGASFDQYRNYMARGDDFIRVVRSLAAKGGELRDGR